LPEGVLVRALASKRLGFSRLKERQAISLSKVRKKYNTIGWKGSVATKKTDNKGRGFPIINKKKKKNEKEKKRGVQ